MAHDTNKQKKSAKPSGFFGTASFVKKDVQKEILTSFSFKAPDVLGVSVVGSFNQWTPGSFQLEKDRSGIWKGFFPLKPGVYEYRFLVNGQWADDPNAQRTVANAFGTKNALLEVR